MIDAITPMGVGRGGEPLSRRQQPGDADADGQPGGQVHGAGVVAQPNFVRRARTIHGHDHRAESGTRRPRRRTTTASDTSTTVIIANNLTGTLGSSTNDSSTDTTTTTGTDSRGTFTATTTDSVTNSFGDGANVLTGADAEGTDGHVLVDHGEDRRRRYQRLHANGH